MRRRISVAVINEEGVVVDTILTRQSVRNIELS